MSLKLNFALCFVSLLNATCTSVPVAKEWSSGDNRMFDLVLDRLIKVEDVVERLQETIKDLSRENVKFCQENKKLRQANMELNHKLAHGSVSKRLLLNSTLITEQGKVLIFLITHKIFLNRSGSSSFQSKMNVMLLWSCIPYDANILPRPPPPTSQQPP